MFVLLGVMLDKEQLLNIEKTFMDEFKTISFLYEGEQMLLPLGESNSLERKHWDRNFQGRYEYRARDGATIGEIFINNPFDLNNPNTRVVMSWLDRVYEYLSVSLDHFKPDPRNIFRPRSQVFHLRREPHSPERLSMVSYVNDIYRRKNTIKYRYIKNELIDGRDCVCVEVSRLSELVWERLWFDFKRQGCVVRWQELVNGVVAATHEIGGFEQVAAEDGRTLWFPTKVSSQYHHIYHGFHKEPTRADTLKIIKGSLRLNAPLDDSHFKIAEIIKKPDVFPNRVPPLPPRRTDPEGVRERLERRLAEAEEQARRVDPGASLVEETNWVPIYSVGFTLLGLLTLGLAYRAWRFR